MASAREAEPVGSPREARFAGLDREDLLGIGGTLRLARNSERMRRYDARPRASAPSLARPLHEQAFVPPAADVIGALRDLAAN